MEEILNMILSKWEIFLLIFIRISGIFIFSPFFSSKNVPNIVKIGFTFMFSIIVINVLDINSLNLKEANYVVLVIKELSIGLIIGFISYVFFSTFYVLGQIIDMETGFAMVNVFDPQFNTQIPVMGNFYYIMSFLIFLTINGHHLLIKALMDSYKLAPIGKFTIDKNIAFFMADIVSKSFSIGFRLSIPVITTILLIDILMGVLSRTMPQMNVFVVGMPLKIVVGLVVVMVTLPLFGVISNNVFEEMINSIYKFLRLLT